MYLDYAIKAVIVAIICYSGTYLWGRTMADRPIVVAAFCGLLMGDLQTGLICGAVLEAIFLGVSHIGGSNLNYCMATQFTTTYCIILQDNFETVWALATAIGTLGILVETGYRFISALFTGYMDRLVAQNKQKQFCRMRFVIFFLTHPIYWAVVFFGVLLGAEAMELLLASIPAFVQSGLNISKGLFGAIGLALVLNQIWDTKICYFFFFGFVLAKYMGLPVMAVLVIAVCLALTIAFRDIQINKLVLGTSGAGASNSEEAFFNE